LEDFNKMVKKYLASYVDERTLNWDEFPPSLMLAYNTSYHSTIATTPFELLFGIRYDFLPYLHHRSNASIMGSVFLLKDYNFYSMHGKLLDNRLKNKA